MGKVYYFFYLEIALRDSNDSHVYAYENVSHISTSKLVQIFNIDLNKDPYLLEGYFLTKTGYIKHKKFIEENIGQINMDVFEYCLRQYSTENEEEIRKLYKENIME